MKTLFPVDIPFHLSIRSLHPAGFKLFYRSVRCFFTAWGEGHSFGEPLDGAMMHLSQFWGMGGGKPVSEPEVSTADVL